MSTLGYSSVDFTPEMNKVTFCISGVESTELKPNVEKKIKPFVFYEKSILEDENEIEQYCPAKEDKFSKSWVTDHSSRF